jgi:hypothetical protein
LNDGDGPGLAQQAGKVEKLPDGESRLAKPDLKLQRGKPELETTGAKKQS